MKSIYSVAALFVLFILFLSGCSNTIRLNNAPSDLVLVSVTPNNSDSVNYSVDSRIPEPYKYTAGFDKFKFAFNDAFKRNIETYMITKFSKVRYGADLAGDGIAISYVVENLELEYDLQQDAIDVVGSLVTKNLYGTFIASTMISVRVSVYRNSQLINEKLVLSNVEKSVDVGGKSVEILLKEALDDGISKTMIMIDKYLVSLGI